MKSGHLSEMEIQQYASGEVASTDIETHLAACAACKTKVEEYRLIFSGLQELEQPQLHFDVAALVLPQIHPTAVERSYISHVFIFMALALLVLPAYLYRNYLITLFTGFSFMALLLISIIAVAIVVFQAIDIYQKYQQRINELNYY